MEAEKVPAQNITLSHEHIAQALNSWHGKLSFKKTEMTEVLRRLRHKTIGLFFGNQAGKTSSVANHYIERAMGICPIKDKNRLARKIRCMSSTLPESSNADEQDNTQYLELKKMIPYELIERDITARAANLVIKRPEGLGSKTTIFEFRSSKQELQDVGKIQLSSVWHDEETPKRHREECKMRLLFEDGDEIFSLTPINYMCFDEETELLTKRGWLKFFEINMNDTVMTYNIDGDFMEWKPMIGFHVYQHDGPMLHMKHKSFDFLVTPNHKWVICNDRIRSNLYLEEAQKLNSKHIIRRLAENVKNGEDNPAYEDNFIAIVGWLASDGTVCKTHTTIYQSLSAYPEKCKAIDEITKDYGEDVKTYLHEYSRTVIEGKEWCPPDEKPRFLKRWSFSGDTRSRIRQVMDGKKPKYEFICSLSTRQLQILLDAIVEGDGYRVKENNGIRLSQINNEALVDTVQLIATLLGRLSRMQKWTDCRGKVLDGVNIYSNTNRDWAASHVKSMTITEEAYNGFVWCPSTENKTVVVRRNGTVSISGNSYTYSDVWQQSNFTYRTKTVAKVLGLPQVEQVNTGKNIACIQAATDDNPTLTIDAIERLFSDITDPDELMIRRYAVFKQISGRLHKTYDPSICYIPFNKYFPDGIPLDWVHARGIDYHDSRIPWSVGWLSLNPRTDEAFLWQEFHPSIDGERAYNTYEIAKRIIRTSGDYQYILNLIDPLANAKQPNTLFSVTDDLNRICEQLRKTEGLGYPQWWQGWDTKGNTGRNEVGMRFKNSVRCGKPFNNRIKERGMNKNLPTLWICDTCPNFNKSLINWRYDEWVTSSSMAIHDQKATPSQKYSHDCMVLECLFKDARLTHASHFTRQNMASANR